MLRMMMMQMGQKPSQKKINQMMTMMNKNMDQNTPKSAKKAKFALIRLFSDIYGTASFYNQMNKYVY